MKRDFVARVFVAGVGLERAKQPQVRAKLLRACGAVPAGAWRPGGPGRHTPVGSKEVGLDVRRVDSGLATDRLPGALR